MTMWARTAVSKASSAAAAARGGVLSSSGTGGSSRRFRQCSTIVVSSSSRFLGQSTSSGPIAAALCSNPLRSVSTLSNKTNQSPVKLISSDDIHHRTRCNCCRPFSSDSGSSSNSSNNNNSNSPQEQGEYNIPGAQAGGKKLAIVYTCKVCETRSIKQFSEHSYKKGVVLIRCPGCQNNHLIADNLGVFEDGFNIEQAMAKLGEEVRVVNNENVLELSLEDIVTQERLDKVVADSDSTSSTNEDKNKGNENKS